MNSKAILAIVAVIALLAGLAAAFFIDVDQTESGAMPDVDVSYESGKMPEYDVKVGDVDVNTTTKTVTVPEVKMVEKEVEVPAGIDFESPEEEAMEGELNN